MIIPIPLYKETRTYEGIMVNTGKFIVIDGGEGAGKGEVLKALQTLLPKDSTVFTREPGGTPLAEEIRSVIKSANACDTDALTQLLLFLAARTEHLQRKVLPALLVEGKNVISDRFDISTYAHQICAAERGRNLSFLFWRMRKDIMQYVPDPLYIYLDVEPEVGLRRVQGRAEGNHFDEKGLEYHRLVRDGYKDFIGQTWHINREQPINGVIVDANQSLEKVIEAVFSIVSKTVGLPASVPA